MKKKLKLMAAIGCCFVATSNGLASRALGQIDEEPLGSVPTDRPSAASQGGVEQLWVTPAPEPTPALRHSFWTKLSDRQNGNAVPFLYRALLMIPEHEVEEPDMSDANIGSPDFPAEAIREFLKPAQRCLEALEIAAARDEVDWGWNLRELRGTDTVAFVLPEVNEARRLGRMLFLKASLEIHERDYEQAIETLRICYALAHAVGQERTLVNSLVATAIANFANDRVSRLIDAPGSPNVYWALAQLPQPLVNFRSAYEYEAQVSVATFPFLADAESESRTAAQWKQLLLGAVRDMKFIGCPLPEASSDELALEALMKDALPKARSALRQQGFTSQQIEAMSRYEAVALAESRVLGGVSDDVFKWSFLPVAESAPFVKHQMETLDPLTASEPLPIGHTLLPALYATRMAEMRSASTWAVLMLVEAVRMHAAQHGTLPRELSEITVVPTFRNPATGAPFAYVLETDANGPVAKITSSVDLMGVEARKTRLEVRIERK